MLKIATYLDLDLILEEVSRLPFWLDGSGAYMAVVPATMPTLVGQYVTEALIEIAKLRGLVPVYMMVNKLPGGVIVPVHTDALKIAVERWHLPLVTNPDCAFSSGEEIVHMELGSWWGPVPYSSKHQVWNKGTVERVHLVVDLENK